MIAFITLFEREISRFLKVIIQTVVTPLVSSFLYLLVFGVTMGNQLGDHSGVRYLAFLLPGLMMMSLMNNAFQNSSSSIISSKYSGDLEDLRVAPITQSQIIWAMSLGSVIRGILVAAITMIVGQLFHQYLFSEFIQIAHWWAVLFFSVAAGLIFGLIGICVAFWAKSFDQLSLFSAFVLLPLTYLGGVFISVQDLPLFWQFLSRMNPLFYLINGLRYGILGVADVEMGQAVVVTLIGFVVCYVIAGVSLKKGSFQRW